MNSDRPDDGATGPRPDGDVVLLEVPGDASAAELENLLVRALDAGNPRIVVDLEQDNRPDSQKIGMLIRFKNRATRNGGDLRLLCPRGRTLEMLQITRLDTVFEIFENRQSALDSFG